MLYGHTVDDKKGWRIYIHNFYWDSEETICDAIKKMIKQYNPIVINLANLNYFDDDGAAIIKHAINLIRENEKSVAICCEQWVKEKLGSDLFVTFEIVKKDIRELVAV